MFIGLVVILFVGHLYLKESFHGSSGSTVTVSISDLMMALGKTQNQQPIVIVNTIPGTTAAPADVSGNKDLTPAYLTMKNTILSDVKASVGDNISGSPLGAAFGSSGPSTAQGNLYVQSIPGKSPADDYIRKDSIPCYACSLP